MPLLSDRFAKNLKIFREGAGLTKIALAKKLEISEGQITKWERGEARPRPDMEDSLAEFFKIDPIELYADPSEGSTKEKELEERAWEKDFILIPLYDLEASAGHGQVIEEPLAPKKHLAFQLSWIKGEKGLSRKELLLVTVVGDSMEPALRQGDVVLVDRAKAHVPDDGLYVLRVDGAMLVKRLHKLPGRRVAVTSDNDAYRSFELDLAHPPEDMAILGRVVWIGREV